MFCLQKNVWSTTSREPEKSYFKFSLDFENTPSHAKIKTCIVACYLCAKSHNQTNIWFGAETYALIQSNLANGRLEALWYNLLWANSRLGSLKILLHALKLFGFLVVGFSALALQLLAKPCCWELDASARALNCSRWLFWLIVSKAASALEQWVTRRKISGND